MKRIVVTGACSVAAEKRGKALLEDLIKGILG